MAFGKRQLVLAALVVALGAAVYLNWQFTGENQLVAAGTDVSEKAVGEAQLVNVSAMSSSPEESGAAVSGASSESGEPAKTAEEYFSETRLSRQQSRDEAVELLEDVLGIPGSALPLLEYDNCVNMMKGAIETANRVTTVSPTYAEEILDPWFSHKMDTILRERSWKLSGILNGIDTESYNPETDKDIYANYSVQDMSGKAVNKLELQKRLNLAETPDVPLIGMVTRMVAHKGLDLVKETLDQLMWESNIQFVILGSGDYEYETFFREMQNKYPGRLCACFGFVPELSRKIYAGADIFLMPSKSEPCGLSQMIALRYGTIPVVRETGGLKDSITDSGDGKGNGFTFKTYNTGDMLHSLHRAIYAYNSDKEGWGVLVDRAMGCDNSWGRSANEYIRLYKQILKG